MSDDASTPIADFRARFEDDRKGGVLRPLGEYLRLFPGDDVGVAREFVRLSERGSSGDEHTRIGPYRIEHELGRGGQGVVYLAEDTRLHRRVALKVLSSAGMASRETLQRFQREAEVTSKLDHPGICTILDTGMEGSVPYIAMKLIEGESLARRIATLRSVGGASATTLHVTPATAAEPASTDRCPPAGLPTDREIDGVVELIEKAARALHDAHEAGVIHRDIKPGNIMVTPAGEPVVMDFGLARELEGEGATLTQTGDLFGTPAYMSPEQLLAARMHLDARTDVYSLGVTLFECLSLQRPFDAPTREGLYHAIQAKAPPALRRLNSAVSSDLAVVVATAMEKDRDRRYQTALAFAEDLRRVRERQSIVAKPPNPLGRLVRWTRRNPSVAALLTLVFLALSCGLWATEIQRRRADENAAISDRNAAAATSALADLERFTGLADMRRLDELLEEDDGLWPAVPELVPKMEAWLSRARRLASRLGAHEKALSELREIQAMSTVDRQERDVRLPVKERQTAPDAHAQTVEIETTTKDEPGTKPAESSTDGRLRQPRRSTRDSPSAIGADGTEAEKSEPIEFPDSTLQWRHDMLTSLVERLTDFRDDGSKGVGIKAVERRISIAKALPSSFDVDRSAIWVSCLDRIESSSKYISGTLTEPDSWLVPLGPDPHTGLEEFADPRTGLVPVRDAATGKLKTTAATSLVFVLVPGGTSWIGAQSDDPDEPNYDPKAEGDEDPVLEKVVPAFFLSKFEMTRGQWLRVSDPDPSRSGSNMNVDGGVDDAQYPVCNVSYSDCIRALRRVQLDLPTEVEWEYGCRGGTSTPWWVGRDPAKLHDAANLLDVSGKAGAPAFFPHDSWDDGFGFMAPVGSLTPNGFGLHDVHGNVAEWCANGYYAAKDRRPTIRESSPQSRILEQCVYRGGSFMARAEGARCAARFSANAGYRFICLGVRPSKRITRR